ncbi:MAG: hypothetical protein ACYC91_05145 [Solirubrobacteraceae bacterium]
MSTGMLIVARAPRPGQAKTRLQHWLGSHGCARLQAELIRPTAAWALAAGMPTWLAHTPGDAEAELRELVGDSVEFFSQASRYRGARPSLADALALRRDPRCPDRVRAALSPRRAAA